MSDRFSWIISHAPAKSANTQNIHLTKEGHHKLTINGKPLHSRHAITKNTRTCWHQGAKRLQIIKCSPRTCLHCYTWQHWAILLECLWAAWRQEGKHLSSTFFFAQESTAKENQCLTSVTDICESTRHDLCGIKLRKKGGWACSKLENQNKLSTHSMHPGAMKIGNWKRVNNLLKPYGWGKA